MNNVVVLSIARDDFVALSLLIADSLLCIVNIIFLLLGNLLFQKLHLLRQICLLIFIIGGQLFKAAIIDFAGDIILIEPFEQAVKFLHSALRLRELSALCSEFFFEDQENNAGRGRRDDRGDRGDRPGGPRRRSDRDDRRDDRDYDDRPRRSSRRDDRDDDFDDRPRRRRSDRDYDDRDDRGYDRDDRPRRRSDRDDRDYDRDDRRGGRSDDRRCGRRGGYDRNPRYATDENYDEYRADRVERSERPRRRVRRDFDPLEN